MQVEGKEQQSGSGTTVQDINKFIKSFEMTQKMMKQMKNNKGGMKKLLNGIDENTLKNFKIQRDKERMRRLEKCTITIILIVAITILTIYSSGIAYLFFTSMNEKSIDYMPSPSLGSGTRPPIEYFRFKPIVPFIIINLVISIILIIILIKKENDTDDRIFGKINKLLYIALIIIPNIVLFLSTQGILSEKISPVF